MADIQILRPGCEDDCEGERGKRGKRGKRGHRGATGATGATGPTGPSSGALIGRQVFDKVAGPFTYVPTPGTRSAIVRGDGGGGGGGGVPATTSQTAATASGGNSGTAIEVEIVAPPNTFLTGGPGVVGAGGPGGVGLAVGTNGGDSTLVIGGVTLVAPGGVGGLTTNATVGPAIIPSQPQPPAVGWRWANSTATWRILPWISTTSSWLPE